MKSPTAEVTRQRAWQQYTAANLSLAWECVMINIAPGVYRAERAGVVMAVVEIRCQPAPVPAYVTLGGSHRQALIDAAHRLGGKAIMVWAYLGDGEGGQARWLDVIGAWQPYPVGQGRHRIPTGVTRTIPMPVVPRHEAEVLWHCWPCGQRHPIEAMCHAPA